VPAAIFVVSRPGSSGLLVHPAVVLDRRGAVAGDHPRDDRPCALIIAGAWGCQGREAIGVELLLCHSGKR
jgi:hypothetical protein